MFLLSCTAERPASNMAVAREKNRGRAEVRTAISALEPFFKPMGPPQEFDWLKRYNEPGQTFDEYLDSRPTLPTSERQTIYILPLGRFTQQQSQIMEITSRYLEVFYDLPVKLLSRRDLKPTAENVRELPNTKNRQVKTGYILGEVLPPVLPSDAAALIALTNEDLFPDETMSFVFGQASLENRVGVWSLNRLAHKADFATFLRRTLKIAAHETGHMFSMRHCTKYECVMSGTNHLGETDRRPIDACPECMAKICWLSEVKAKPRYEKLTAFCARHGLKTEADEFTKKAAAVR